MKSETRIAPFRQPNEVLNKLIAAGMELVHLRDSALAVVLDVSPPSLEPVSVPASGVSENVRGMAYRGTRKIYRSLKRVEFLQPLLEKLRDNVRQRL
jgi:hypothetical protein